MSSHTGTVSLVWENGEDQFCLRIGELLALEDKCSAAIMVVYDRVRTHTAYVNDIRETIRFGLIGGGMTPEKAMAAVKLHVDTKPLLEHLLLAHAILAAGLVGVQGDSVGKQEAAEAETQATDSSDQMAASVAVQSSDLVQPLGGQSVTPTPQPSGNLQQPLKDTIEQTALGMRNQNL